MVLNATAILALTAHTEKNVRVLGGQNLVSYMEHIMPEFSFCLSGDLMRTTCANTGAMHIPTSCKANIWATRVYLMAYAPIFAV